MPEQLSKELVPFKTIILSLASYAMHPKLDLLIEKLTPTEKPSTRFLIKVEIKRLSKPCPYVIDLRNYFTECKPVQYQHLCHYLDEISKTLFLESVEKNNGLFTMNIYNEINEDAKQRHLKLVKQTRKNEPSSQIKAQQVKSFSLINENICNDKQLKVFSNCKVFTYDPIGMSRQSKEEIGHSVTVHDLNPQYCVIKAPLETIDNQSKVIYLWLYNHDRQLEFHQDIILKYTIEDFKAAQSNSFTHYRLKLHITSNAKMTGYLTDLLNSINQTANDLLAKQIKPLVDSVYAKSHEQFVMNNTQDIVMVCAPYKTGWRPTSGLQTPSNSALWDFFSSAENTDPLARLFCDSSLQSALDNNHEFDQYAYVLRHNYQENGINKDQFIILWQQQLIDDLEAQKYFKNHVLNGNYRYIRFSFKQIDAMSDAYNPCAVPSYTSPDIAMLNRALGKQVSDKLKASNYLAILSDVTEINVILGLSKLFKVKEKLRSTDAPLKCPVSYALPLLQRRSPMEVVTSEGIDLRSEDRFDIEFAVTITRCGNQSCTVSGFTENISIQGLSIKLGKSFPYLSGEEVELSIAIPHKAKTVTLTQQKYKIIAGKDPLNLHLCISANEARHAASWMIRAYIYQNMDTLKPSGFEEDQTYGFEKALRNIYAKNHSTIPFFINKNKQKYFINSLATSKNSAIKSLVFESENSAETLVNLVQQEKFSNYCLSLIKQIDESQSTKSFYLLILPRNTSSNSKQAFWFNDINQLQQSGKLAEVINKIRSLGEPSILRVQLAKSHQIMDKYFREELQYLAQISSQKADELVNTIEQVSAIGEISDHTEQMLELIDHWILKKEPLKLANVG